jgi:peroxiredoxin
MPNQWTFPVALTKKSTNPIFLAYQRDWGRPAGDKSVVAPGAWKARMTVLHRLAQLGSQSLPILLEGLDDEDQEVRDLSAQAIAYFGDRSVLERLDRAIYEDPSPTVRIYAAIARASIGGPLPEKIMTHISRRDPSSEVRIRLELLLGRQPMIGNDLSRSALANFDLSRMDTARVGQPAPDFSLTDVDGRTFRLSDFHNKKKVVLIFVYGATCMFCTGQIANLRLQIPEFEAQGTQVLVVEANDSYRMQATLEGARIPPSDRSIALLSDSAHVVAATYGVAMQMSHIEWLNRPSTFLIDRQGILRKAYLSDSPGDRPWGRTLIEAAGALDQP